MFKVMGLVIGVRIKLVFGEAVMSCTGTIKK